MYLYFRERMEVQLEKEARLLQLQATSRYSQDSAIDSDLQDWDTEILNIDLVYIISNNQIIQYFFINKFMLQMYNLYF